MSHEIFKKLALVSLSGLMVTTAAYAGDDTSVKIGGKLRAYVGQYTSGVKNENAHLVEFGEANLGTKIKKGNLSAYFELESRNQGTMSAIQRRADAKFGDFKVSFGTIKPKESYALADDSNTGTMTSDSHGVGFYKGELIKTEAQGVRFEYKINKIKAGVSLYVVDPMNSHKYKFTDGKVSTTTETTISGTTATSTSTSKIGKSHTTGIKEYKAGSGTQVGAHGYVGPIEFSLSSLSSKTDDHTSTATVLSHSGTQVGVRYKVMDSLKVSVDSGAKTIAKDKVETKKTSDTAVQVQYKFGDDSVVATVANVDYKESDKTASDYTEAVTSAIYNMNLAKHTDFKFLYATTAHTPKTGDVITKSYVGAGLFVKF